MADDLTQRPYRSSDSIARATPAKSSGAERAGDSASDPLAELARLIGQTDPFAEYGRARAPGVPEQRSTAAPDAPGYHSALPAADADPYQVPSNEHGYPVVTQDAGYGAERFHPDQAQHTAEYEDLYEDVTPKRKRAGILLVAGIFGLAVVGSAGAFGYRALFGKSGSSAPPPVIKAETTPSKIVPATSGDVQSTKLITDRVNERGLGEQLVSREEQPVAINDKSGTAFPPPQDQANAAMPAVGSGVVSPDAKRVRTIAIRPDQSIVADATPAAPTRVTTVTPPVRPAVPAAQPQQQAPPPRAVAAAPAAEPDAQPEQSPPPPQRTAPTRAATPAAPSANAPLSLNANAPARAPRAATAPVRTASAPTTQTASAPASGGGSYAVQLSSQRSEAEAQAAFRSLQGKYPNQLGGKQPLIHKVNLGAKGIYYRAMVGPFATGGEASELCSSLKAAGGDCIVQRN